MLKIIFESILVQKTVSEVLKTWYFPYSAVWSQSSHNRTCYRARKGHFRSLKSFNEQKTS